MSKLDPKTKSILARNLPEDIKEIQDYILPLEQVKKQIEDDFDLGKEEAKEHPKVVQAREALIDGINAATGAMKLIEQVFGESASVEIAPQDMEIKNVLARTFGGEHTQITFDMYKQAIEGVRIITDKVQKGLIDDLLGKNDSSGANS